MSKVEMSYFGSESDSRASHLRIDSSILVK